MTGPTRKVFRDFWEERTRTALVVVAITVGIAAFAAVLASYAILTRELDRGYLATDPASATFHTDVVDPALLRAILAGGGVSDAEAGRVVSARIRTGPMEWRSLTLFVVDDYSRIRIGKITPESGAWPPGPGEMLIERDAFQVARARIGDTVTVKTARGTEVRLRVSGGVHDVGQAQARMENGVYGYITRDTLARLGEEPYLDRVKILAARNRYDEPSVRALAEQVRRRIEIAGHPVTRMDVPRPGKHPHADITGLLLLVMASFGAFALVLSGALVVNFVAALMASQTRQIGVMKTVGATRGRIARIYLGQALLLGGTAVVAAVPLAVLGSRVLCRAMAIFLNFDIASFAIPAWVYLLVAAIGLAVPLLASAVPVWRRSGMSIREALADSGGSGNTFGSSAFDRALAGARGTGMTRPLLLAVRNGFRRRTRLALTVATLTAGGLFFVTALNVRSSLIRTLDHLFAARKYDLTVGLAGMYPFAKVEGAVRRTPGIVHSEGWITTEGFLPARGHSAPAEPHVSAAGSEAGPAAPGQHASPQADAAAGPAGRHGGPALGTDRFTLVAFPPGTKLIALDIVAGRALKPGDTDAVVLNTAMAALLPESRVGSTVALRLGHGALPWRVVGIAREPLSPPGAYVPQNSIEEIGSFAGMTDSVRLVLEKRDPASILRVKADLERNLEGEDVHAVSSSSKADGRYGFDQHMLMIYIFLIVTSCVLGGVGGLGLMTTMSLNVLERRREMGVLRAIGATPSAVWRIVVAEGLLIGVSSWALAALAAWPLSDAIGNLLASRVVRSTLDPSHDPHGVVIWLAVSIFLSILASFLPAWRASQSPIREALGYE